MQEFKGTPGTWVADKTSRAVGPVSKEDDQSYGMVLPVAWVEFEPEVENQAANQQLIAAAPELLEALQKIVAMNEQYCLEKYGDSSKADTMACVTTAHAAIAKALGQ